MLFMVRPDVKSVHLLADLLETIGVTADELLDQKLAGRDLAGIRAMSDVEVQDQLVVLRRFVGRVRELELAIVAKLNQARERSRQVARTDWRLRPIMMLFASGTQAFADQFTAEAQNSGREFEGAHQIFPFLRSRGLLSDLATHYDGSAELLVTDSFRLLGAMRLRDLLERCEATLNTLDAHYDLFETAEDEAEEITESVTSRTAETAPVPAPIAEAPEVFRAAVNWGADIPTLTGALPPVAEPQAAVALEAAPDAVVSQEAVAPVQQGEAEIAAAQEASEAGLKALSERLADMKAAPAAEPMPKASAA